MPIDEDRRRWWIEIGVVLAVGWLVHLLSAMTGFVAGMSWDGSAEEGGPIGETSLDLAYQTAGSIQVLAPVLFIMWLGGKWSDFGIVRLRPLRDAGVGIGIAVLDYGAYYMLAMLLYYWAVAFGINGYFLDGGYSAGFEDVAWEESAVAVPWASVIVMLVANSFAEEFVFRGVLLERLTRLLGRHQAVWISAALFASYHMYQGAYGVVSAMSMGVIAAYSMRLTKSIWPCVIAHTAANVLSTAMSG